MIDKRIPGGIQRGRRGRNGAIAMKVTSGTPPFASQRGGGTIPRVLATWWDPCSGGWRTPLVLLSPMGRRGWTRGDAIRTAAVYRMQRSSGLVMC